MVCYPTRVIFTEISLNALWRGEKKAVAVTVREELDGDRELHDADGAH